MRYVQLFVALALVLCVAVAAEAQPGGRGQRGQGGFGQGGFGGQFGGGGGGGSLIGLLGNEAVQKELGLTEDQITAVRELQRELRPQRGPGAGGPRGEGRGEGRPRGEGGEGRRPRGPRGSDNEARLGAPTDFFVQQPQPGQRRQLSEEERAQLREEAEARAKKEQEELAKILKPEQLKRLKEIYIQQAGTQALNTPWVAEELGITADQRERMATARREAAESLREAFQGGGDREGARERLAELRRGSEEKLLAVLSADQKRKFEEMKGEPFEMPRPERRPGGPGGAGGRPARPE
jgi:hypothetical protein